MEPQIAVIDFGSQYTQLIVRRLRELGYFSKLYQPESLRETGSPKGIILSGGPRSVLEDGAPDIDDHRICVGPDPDNRPNVQFPLS